MNALRKVFGRGHEGSVTSANQESGDGGGLGTANPTPGATGHHAEMQMQSQPPSRIAPGQPRMEIALGPPERKDQQPAPRENSRQSVKRAAPKRWNSVTETREWPFADSKDKEIAQLKNCIRRLHEGHDRELGEAQARLVHSEREKQELSAKIIEVCKERDNIAKDNMALRACNVSMRSPHGQYPDDENYIQQIKNLNESMKIWVKNAFKSSEHPQLSDDDDVKILRIIHRQGGFEPLLSMLLSKDSLRSIYSNSPCRIMLARHLISLHLLQYIFLPICFGIDSDAGRLMDNILQSILKRGYPLFMPPD